MFKKLLLLGLIAGVMAGVAALVYQRVYTSFLGADFSSIAKPVNIVIVSTLSVILASVAYGLLTKWLPRAGEIVFNFAFVLLTFASIIGPFAMKLPLDFEAPELFPGLTVPMHFFPALAWFTLKPLFVKN
jgi:choline-glycine betaine transporter